MPCVATLVERRPRAESERRQDRKLVRRIDAVDVERRVGLGIAQRLRLGEHLGEVAALRLHLGEDEIARAVEDAVDARHRIRRRALAQPLDHRDAARDRRLELQRHARRLGRARQLQPVVRQHRLVGGDEALARRRAPRAPAPAPGPSDPPTSSTTTSTPSCARERARCRRPRRSATGRPRDPSPDRAPTPRRPRSRARRAARSARRARRAARSRRRRRCPAQPVRRAAVRHAQSPLQERGPPSERIVERCAYAGPCAHVDPPRPPRRTARSAPDAELPRGILLGGLITLLFTAANVYLGLKVGLTFATSIPAAVISMAILRYLPGATILENNIVQTVASAAGTLAAIIFVLPGLVMIGWWQGFPYVLTAGITATGGILGVMFSVPLRRALVVDSPLPYPEGRAAAEVLKVGAGSREGGEESAARAARHRRQRDRLRRVSRSSPRPNSRSPRPHSGSARAQARPASRAGCRSRWSARAISSACRSGWRCSRAS